jgi:hypothetical protein
MRVSYTGNDVMFNEKVMMYSCFIMELYMYQFLNVTNWFWLLCELIYTYYVAQIILVCVVVYAFLSL